jgi:hypothetical protein
MNLNNSVEMFYKSVIESSSDEESDDDFELIMATAALIYEQNSRPRGSTKPRRANIKRNREKGHYQLYRDYFHPTYPANLRGAHILAPLPDVKVVVHDYLRKCEGIQPVHHMQDRCHR